MAEEGSYILTIKNPAKPSPPGVGLRDEQKAELPGHLREKFDNRRFINADPPDLLDYDGIEFVLIGAVFFHHRATAVLGRTSKALAG